MADKGTRKLKVLSFCGRVHHFERLSPVVNKLREMGHEAIWLVSSNSVVNNDVAEEFLVPAGEKFIHSDDYIRADDVPTISDTTRKTLNRIYTTEVGVDSDLQTFIEPFWISASVREFSELVVAYCNIIGEYKPDVVMILHGANAFGNLLAYACQESGVPVVSFQEGKLRYRDSKTQGKFALSSEYSTKVLMWSEQARQGYIDAGVSPDKVEVVGIPHLDEMFTLKNNTPPERWLEIKANVKYMMGFNPAMPLVTFALPQLGRYEGNPMKAIGMLSDWSANNAVPLALRFHPFEGEGVVSQVEDGLKLHPYAKVIKGGKTLDLVCASDLVLVQHSTIADESLAMGVPVAEIDFEHTGILESLTEQGVAVTIQEGELDKIKQILSGQIVISSADLHEWLDKNIGARDGKSAERVAKKIEEIGHGLYTVNHNAISK